MFNTQRLFLTYMDSLQPKRLKCEIIAEIDKYVVLYYLNQVLPDFQILFLL